MERQRASPNIYIVGPQCTGKTTIVNELRNAVAADTLWSANKPQFVSEVARSVLKQHDFATEEIRSSPERSFLLQTMIMDAQAKAEIEALEQASWFVSDRSGVDPIVYAKRYVGDDAARNMELSATWLELKTRMSNSLVVLCESGCKWLQDDGVRLMPTDEEDWTQFYRTFCATLQENDVRYCVVSCEMLSLKERVDFVITQWKQCFA